MSYTLEELQAMVEASGEAKPDSDRPEEKGRSQEEVRADMEALTKRLYDEVERSRHYDCNKRIAYLEAGMKARDRAAGKGYTHNRAGQPHWCCAYCRGQECFETCPTQTHPLEGK